MVEVEKLLPLIARLTEKPVMQEPLTRAILEEVEPIAPRCTVGVLTIGTHSGVEVVCEVGNSGV